MTQYYLPCHNNISSISSCIWTTLFWLFVFYSSKFMWESFFWKLGYLSVYVECEFMLVIERNALGNGLLFLLCIWCLQCILILEYNVGGNWIGYAQWNNVLFWNEIFHYLLFLIIWSRFNYCFPPFGINFCFSVPFFFCFSVPVFLSCQLSRGLISNEKLLIYI